MTGKPKTSAARVAAHEAAHRAAGKTQKKCWADPQDWPDILAYIAAKNEARKQKI